MGFVKYVTTSLAKGVSYRRPQIESLEEWAAMMKTGMIVAVRVSADERLHDGDYWLAKLVSEHVK